MDQGDRAREEAELVARRSYGKLIAVLAARTGDVAAAEDALAEAFASALVTWPTKGAPSNPEAWLLTVARRKGIDVARRRVSEAKAVSERNLLDELAAQADHDIPDRRLGLLFACAHPAIDPAARSPLLLQVVLGLDATRIAAAFLTSPSAMGKRLVRAKEKIRAARIPFRIPEAGELADRLATVLEAIYAAFSEGWSDPLGTDPSRRDLTGEAIFLARLVVELEPAEPEPLGLLALMLHAEARRDARRTDGGSFVPLDEQDPDRWRWAMIEDAERLIRRAAAFGKPGRYQLEAAIQSAHVTRRRTGEPNWGDLVTLYDLLGRVAPSPVVAVNRAAALAERDGPDAGLAALLAAGADGRLAEYQPYWAARADLERRAGDVTRARESYRMAIGLERDPAVRQFLLGRSERLPA